ncbi:MAG TPA: rhodanese-like domain-containing protein [Terriglobia bacterium]|nr:rhodanese-like domain-containing protein [Terriglobia bacterium]
MQNTCSSPKSLIFTSLAVALAASSAFLAALASEIPTTPARDPWVASQLIAPVKLAKELAEPRSQRPRVVCVGFEVLYRGAHVPGARYAGPARQPSGVAELKRWAAALPKNTPIVIYCGCCPMKRCPNVRPAFAVLRQEGFTCVRVLNLPDSFAQDWVEKGYPAIRGE